MSRKDRACIAVLLGGFSSEREVSLESGRAVAAALDPRHYRVRVFDPLFDLPRLVAQAKELDAALVMLHGRGGEDGRIQGLLDILGVPYQCSGMLGCALAMDKVKAKAWLRMHRLPVAEDVVLTRGQRAPVRYVLERLGLPVVVKPAREGSSLGISMVFKRQELAPALKRAFELDDVVIVERFLEGREFTAAVLGAPVPEPLPLVEIIPGESHEFFDYKAKYTPGATKEICPAPLDEVTTRQIQELAVKVHLALELWGYSRTDLILTENGPVILEVNTIPGMTRTSLLPLAAKAAGMSFEELVERLVRLALSRWGDKGR